MSKHLWRFAGGIVVFMTFYLPYRFGKYIVVSADEFWNKSILEKILGRELPFLGFFISIALFYFIGAANETRIALWLREKLLNKIPILNKFLASLSPQSKNVIQGSKGFFLAPFWDGYRPAKLTAVLKKKSGDRKSTRLNSSHSSISYAVFCLKNKKFYKTIIYKHQFRFSISSFLHFQHFF